MRRVLAAGLRHVRRWSPSLADRIDHLAGALRILVESASSRRVGLVVLYHRIEPLDGDAQRELVPGVGVATFRRQLRWLRRVFRVVRASDILEAAERRSRWSRIPLAVTFDDEWQTHDSLALPVLRETGVPATFFFTGAHLRERTPFWWESLQHAHDNGLDTREVVKGETIFDQERAMTSAEPAERVQAAMQLRALLGPTAPSGMTPAQIRTVAEAHDVGFHTRVHHPLTSLTEDELAEALVDSRDALERLIGRPTTLFAYPHGAAGAREASAAAVAGFALAFTTEALACGRDTDARLIGRVEPGVVAIGGYLRALAAALRP